MKKRSQKGALIASDNTEDDDAGNDFDDVGADQGDNAKVDLTQKAGEENAFEGLVQDSARNVTTINSLTARQRITAEWEEYEQADRVSSKIIEDMGVPPMVGHETGAIPDNRMTRLQVLSGDGPPLRSQNGYSPRRGTRSQLTLNCLSCKKLSELVFLHEYEKYGLW